MKLAFLYAGQGSQHPGMGRDLYAAYPAFQEAFDAASLPFDLHAVCFDDPQAVLNQTQYTQPCMVAFAAGVTAELNLRGIIPQYAAGLSLGEYGALTAAGVFSPKQAIELAAFRGQAMADAAAGVESAMLAVMMLDRDTLAACCRQARTLGVVDICNYNCPGQLVIGGEKQAVLRAGELAREAGARRCLPLKVSGPFHTALMHPAGERLAARFAHEEFSPMRFPVLFNCLGREKDEVQCISDLLVRQVQQSVYMEDIIRRLLAMGVDTVIEIGPGRALSGFVKKTVGDAIACFPAEDVQTLEATCEVLSTRA